MICGRRFSFITIASIDFWSDLQLIFLYFNACILPSIIRHTVAYAVWYGVWFLMVWPWFGHSSLNHNEYAVSSAVSRMKMPPVREHASSLITILLPHFGNKRQVYPGNPRRKCLTPRLKIPRPGPTRNKTPRPEPTRNKIPRLDPTRKHS